MIKKNIQQKHFLPAFPIKSQRPKVITKKKKTDLQVNIKFPADLCEKLYLFKNDMIETKTLVNHSKNNFYEMKSLVMAPIRPTTVQISLPDFSISSPKFRVRKTNSTINRKKSIENKHGVNAVNSLAEVPVEIITTRCTPRISSARTRFDPRKSESSIMSKSAQFKFSMQSNKNKYNTLKRMQPADSSKSIQRKLSTDKDKIPESNCNSPSIYSPIYTNNFDT
jgi:hypothetical protein